MGSTSAGASAGTGAISVGIGFGQTWKSESCERRANVRSLQTLGQDKAALALIAQDASVADALDAAGVDYPKKKSDKSEPVAAPAAKPVVKSTASPAATAASVEAPASAIVSTP